MAETQEPSFSERIYRKMSAKADQHSFLTNSLVGHEELFKSPHLKSFYSNTFKDLANASKMFCEDVSTLKVEQTRRSLQG